MTLSVADLRKSYPTATEPLVVLNGVNLTLGRGEACLIMGPSGSGKSTFLHILGTLDQPTSGRVRLENVDPFSLTATQLAQFRNRRIGFIFQDHHLLPQFTVLENVLIPTLVNPESDPKASEQFARELIERVGLTPRIQHRPAELSGGERQRVAVARALIQKPLLLLADEPTGNLDRHNADAITELLLDLHRQQNTMLVLVTHSLALKRFFSHRYSMIDGVLQSLED